MKAAWTACALSVLALGFALPRTAAPAPTAYTVDSVHSSVVFRVKHMGVSWFYGRFDKVEGSVSWDEAKPEDSKVEVTIAADSIDTNNKKRDDDLRAPDFFSVKEFPTITFKSTKVAKKDSKLAVTGDLTLHGVTKSVTVDVDPVGAAETRMGARAGFETVFEIKRSDYGMKNMLEGIGDDIRLMVSLECTKAKS